MKNALIIGAGVSGLATAIRLAAAGWAVEVHEAAEGPGGKMGSLEQDGFRWDTGPSLFTWPALAEELFHSAGRSLSEYIPLRRLSLITRYRFADGTLVDAPSEAEAFATALERQCGEPVRNTLNYLDDCRRLFELTRPVFLEHPPGIGRIFSKDYLQAYPHLYRLRAWTSLHRHHARVFHTPQAMQLFDRYATYSGSNPYSAPATLRVIAHLEHNEGAYFPEQGMYGFARGLYRLGQELGVSYHFNSRALRLVERSGRIAGVETTRGFREAGVVVSSADVSGPEGFSREDPLPPERLSSSAIIFFLGLNKSYPGLDLHNMFFSADYQNEFRQMFSELNLAPDMSIYVFVSSKLVPSDAPPGHENWFVMVNAPPDAGQDWGRLAAESRERILDKLEQSLGQPIRPHIVSEARLLPTDLATTSGAWRGALYGPNGNRAMSAFHRHPVQGRRKNLFHTGGSVHPGGGIPLCLLSARIATAKILSL